MPVLDYQARWRTDHAGRMAQVPGLARYVQSHPLPQGYTKGELLFDGIEELCFADEAAFNRAFKRHVGVPPVAWRKRSSCASDF